MKRSDFPQLREDLVYLDTAATALKPQCVIDAVTDFYAHHYGTVHRAVYRQCVEATARYDEARQKAAAFLNASPDQIVFTKGTTESINLVANSIDPGDEVVISEIEHHANIVPWQLRGAKLTVLPVDDTGHIIPQPLPPNTKLVSIVHLSNALGTLQPVEAIIAEARKVGAKVLIDGAQSAPHLPIDVQKLDCDYFVFSGHKLYGPTGIGVLYGKDLDALPPYQGGGDMIERVTFEKTTFQKPPLRFEAGTPPIAQAIGLGAALDAFSLADGELFSAALDALQAIPRVHIVGEPDHSIISFVVEGAHPLDIGTLLDLDNIAIRTGHHCAQPTMRRFGVSATCRLSLGIYNTFEDIDRFASSLNTVLSRLKGI